MTVNAQTKKLLGWESPDDKDVKIKLGHWNAMRLALWRSKYAWEIVVKQAEAIEEACKHAEGCPATDDETAVCLAECPDRETRMSALVILNAARQFAPVDARQLAKQPYFAPSREHFSEVVAELGVSQLELEAIRGSAVTVPPEPEKTVPEPLPAQRAVGLVSGTSTGPEGPQQEEKTS